MNFLKMQKKVAAIVAAAMITTTLVPMGAIAMAENQTEKKAVKRLSIDRCTATYV